MYSLFGASGLVPGLGPVVFTSHFEKVFHVKVLGVLFYLLSLIDYHCLVG